MLYEVITAFTYAELVRATGRRAVEASLTSRELVKVTRGLYASSGFAGSPWVAAAAVCCESAGALTGRAALAAWGAILDAPTEFTVVVITSYSIHYTKLYEQPSAIFGGGAKTATPAGLLSMLGTVCLLLSVIFYMLNNYRKPALERREIR